MQDFRDLKVWEKAHELVLLVYQVTASFPKEEMYGLTSQIRRSASSVPMNIAEGCGRGGNAEFSHFLKIAYGSASELDYQLLLTHDLKLMEDSVYRNLSGQVVEIKKMLTALIKRVNLPQS